MRLALRWLSCAGVGLIGVAALMAGILSFPQPLFAYHVSRNRLEIWSDRPFDPARGQAILADVENRLSRSELNNPTMTHRIFVANEPWRERLFFLWSYGAAGLNYAWLTHNVFIRHSDIDHDIVYGHTGQPAPEPHDFVYYAAHEIGHSLVSAEIGALANFRLPRWVREGMPDYIALANHVDEHELARRFRAGDPQLDPVKSGRYDRYFLLTAFALEHEKVRPVALLAHPPKQAELENKLRQSDWP